MTKGSSPELGNHQQNILFDNMRNRIILIVISCCLFSLAGWGQTEHLKFMDIPINGSINSFQKKLIKKGILPDSQRNSGKAGIRSFKGDFYGYDADIIVFFDKYTQKVYMARAIINSEDSIVRNNIYTKFQKKLEKKYGNPFAINKAYNSPTFAVMYQGMIDCYPKSLYFDDDFPAKYSVFIDYMDIDNHKKHEKSMANDL